MSVHLELDFSQLDAYRQVTDKEADDLVKKLIPKQGSEKIGPLGYNTMLLLADRLNEDPELALIGNSQLSQQLNEMPPDLVDYFKPMPAPDWVDIDKLRLGSELWRENTLMSLLALYSASLPACYLMKNGIPALYKTEKLAERQYIFQRIYETGLMLAATMDQDGIRIVEDAELEREKLLLKALNNVNASGHWEQQGPHLCRTNTEGASMLDTEKVLAEMQRLSGRKRYIWGNGYIAAKKVRFLHASMRYMLTHPQQFQAYGDKDKPQTFSEAISQRDSAWDSVQYGKPVNQEDMAYTLLTFGLVIPQALSKWGLTISREQKEAFLHLWCLIGHIMGIDRKLLTDNWDEAEDLFKAIQQRQAGSSDEGLVLTQALMGFLDDYLPHTPGIAHRLSAALMIGQLGSEKASYLLDETLVKETTCFWRKPIYALGRIGLKSYLLCRERYFKRFPHLGGMTAYRLHQASELLIDSWRDGYLRKPFFVPVNPTTWVRQPGVNKKVMEQLRHWRRRLFLGLGCSIGFLAIALFGLAGSIPAGLLWGVSGLKTSLIVAGSSWLTSLCLLQFWLPVIFKARPDPKTIHCCNCSDKETGSA